MPKQKIVKTWEEMRADALRVQKNGAARHGKTLDVGPGSDPYIRGTAYALQLGVALNNIEAADEARMPATATGADLDRFLDQYGLSRRSAGGSFGRVTLLSNASTLVVTGSELSSPQGIIFRVTEGGTYQNGDTIPVSSADVGAQTNLEEGTILKWASPPAYTAQTATLSTASTGGVDEENDEVARQRLLSRLQTPPAAANWSWVKVTSEGSDPSVQAAFVYPCANGPGTVYVAVAGQPNRFNRSRQVDPIKLNSVIIPTILGEAPAASFYTVQNVQDVPVDLSFQLSLPAGANNGWANASPFPQVDGSLMTRATVTLVTDSSHVTVESLSPPASGVSKIAWVDRTDSSVKTATVTGYTGSGPYALTLDAPLVGVAVGDFISPAAANLQGYVSAVLDFAALMGPGEKTTVASLLPRALRQPRPNISYPMSIDSRMLKVLTDSGDEVESANFLYRSGTTPAIPSLITDSPNIFIPRHLAFYA